MSFSLTEHLLASDPSAFTTATQSTFLRRAAQGTLPKDILGKWLANDRLYIHGYIRGAGRLLTFLQLPEAVPTANPSQRLDAASSRLLAWTIDALVNIKREENFFVQTASRYGIDVNVDKSADGKLEKLPGLVKFEALFDGLQKGEGLLPWLECAIVFWGTEKVYLDAWTWAKSQLDEKNDGSQDQDGGAVRKEFIGNWTSEPFIEFVNALGKIIDDAVDEEVKQHGEEAKNQIVERALGKWRALVEAEQAFWPTMN